jgi:uncharacterized protein
VSDFPADIRPRAATPSFTVASNGVDLPGVLHLPAGRGPHPVAVLLHGFPGNERNFDLAQALRRAGAASLVFHYRGSWGAGGTWRWSHVVEDSAAAVEAVRSSASAHRLDADRIALVGHSLGGFAALVTTAADPRISAVASIAGFDFGPIGLECRSDPAVRASYVSAFEAELLPLRGTDGAALVREMMQEAPQWQLAALAPGLANRPVLLIGAALDAVAPVDTHYHPVVKAYAKHPVPVLEHHLFQTDHALSDHRLALADVVRRFLTDHLRVNSTA